MVPDPLPPTPVREIVPAPGVARTIVMQPPMAPVPIESAPIVPGVPRGAIPPLAGGSLVRSGGAMMPPVENQMSLENGALEVNPIVNLLDFWFGFLPGPNFFPQYKLAIWFASSPEIDRQILDNFGQDLNRAGRGEYNSWRDTPRGRLALILLLDQIPRHIYRNQTREFTFDRMAQALVLEGIRKGDDRRLYPIERAFFYLPLEHAEDLNLQNLAVTSYRRLLAESPEELKPEMVDFLQSALLSQRQIVRFGRFPYRNTILGREPTPEETVFLMQWRTRGLI
jgi:uncharacterized protein (DUF924 family)